jgi:hypothetical protein
MITYIIPVIIALATPTLTTKNVSEPAPIVYQYSDFKLNKIGLKKEVFDKAIKGYNKLIAQGKIKNKRYITICDMSQSSKNKRFYLIDLNTKKIIYNLRVTHGSESGDEFATKFSNITDSHQTSLGFYTTGTDYYGENGYSMKLHGHEANFNDNAYNRAVVLHGSEYATETYYKQNKKIGRSWGCPAISQVDNEKIIKLLKNGSCLFIYHSDKTYNKKSKFLK